MLSRLCAVLISGAVLALGGATASSAAEKKPVQMRKITGAVKVAPPVVTNLPTRGAVELTSGECTGLGGKVVAVNKACNASGQKACKTVDSDGVVRVACIDEVKN